MSDDVTRESPPQPAFTIEVSVGGCDWGTVCESLTEAIEHVRTHGPNVRRIWGGAGVRGHVVVHRREVTQNQYNAELIAWHMPTVAARAAEGGTTT